MPHPAFDLDAYFALPRITNLHVSPDGSRLAATVHTVAFGEPWQRPHIV
jgi:hypothetical protein